MKIIIDTHIVHRDYHLQGRHILTLTDISVRLGYEVLIPEVVIDEIDRQYCEKITGAVGEYNKFWTMIVDMS